MSLTPGTRLGPYEVLGRLGTGGMGEVYRARDTRLGREVALKLLPEDVARDPVRLSRLEHEARSSPPPAPPRATLFASRRRPAAAPRHGAVPGETLAERARGSPARGSLLWSAGRRGPRGGAREGHRPPRPQARQRQDHPRREGQGARLRRGPARRSRAGPPHLPDAHRDRRGGRRGEGLGHRGVHEPGAGAGTARGPARGRVGSVRRSRGPHRRRVRRRTMSDAGAGAGARPDWSALPEGRRRCGSC
jgi:hypothetical protein